MLFLKKENAIDISIEACLYTYRQECLIFVAKLGKDNPKRIIAVKVGDNNFYYHPIDDSVDLNSSEIDIHHIFKWHGKSQRLSFVNDEKVVIHKVENPSKVIPSGAKLYLQQKNTGQLYLH